MAIQTQDELFTYDRAARYNAAMDQYPAARYLEILPLMCLFAREEVCDWHLVDLASGGGYLGGFFEKVARRVTYLDRSPDMLTHVDSENVVVGDLCDASAAMGEGVADLVTCLAAFHHVHVPGLSQINGVYTEPGTRDWAPERHLSVGRSQQLHESALADWSRLLKGGGWMVLIDVPGYPDAAWDPFWPSQKPRTMNIRGYQEEFLQRLSSWRLATDLQVLERFFDNGWRNLWETDEQIQAVRGLMSNGASVTMQDIVRTYQLPQGVFRQASPMVPTDFFDDVIDRLGNQRHFAYFPREEKLRRSLCDSGLQNVMTGTFPTPWVFDSKEAAVWFVHELFGLGSAWSRDAIPASELAELTELVEKYLGLHEDSFGRTLLFWQLTYFVAQKPVDSGKVSV